MALGASTAGASQARLEASSQIMDLEINGKKLAVRVLIDSGAELSFISQRIIAENGLSATTLSIRAHAVDGHEVQVYGEHDLKVHATDERGPCYEQAVHFLASNISDFDVILGQPWLRAVNPDILWDHGLWSHRPRKPITIEVISHKKILRIAARERVGMIMISAYAP